MVEEIKTKQAEQFNKKQEKTAAELEKVKAEITEARDHGLKFGGNVGQSATDRQAIVKQLIFTGMSDLNEIAALFDVKVQIIKNDIKKIKHEMVETLVDATPEEYTAGILEEIDILKQEAWALLKRAKSDTIKQKAIENIKNIIRDKYSILSNAGLVAVDKALQVKTGDTVDLSKQFDGKFDSIVNDPIKRKKVLDSFNQMVTMLNKESENKPAELPPVNTEGGQNGI